MNAIDLLKEDHQRVSRLFKKVRDTEKGEHPALFKQIKAELDVHTHIEETVFYPALLKKGNKELKDITLEGIEEHHQAKMFLGELGNLSGSNKRFEPKLTVLMEDIEHHVKEEESDMFKQVQSQFSEAALEKLGLAMEREKVARVKALTASERTALQRSLAASSEKGPLGSLYEKAKEAVGSMLPGKSLKASGSENGSAKMRTVKPAVQKGGTRRKVPVSR